MPPISLRCSKALGNTSRLDALGKQWAAPHLHKRLVSIQISKPTGHAAQAQASSRLDALEEEWAAPHLHERLVFTQIPKQQVMLHKLKLAKQVLLICQFYAVSLFG